MSALPVGRPPDELYDFDDAENACLLCGRPRFELLYEIRHYGFPFRFQRCACGLIKQTPMPNRRFFEWFFNSEVFFSAKEAGSERIWGFYDYFRDEPCRLSTSHRRYRRLRRFFPDRPLEVLKIGPSTGTFLHVANQHGHHAIGCDVSSRFVDFARQTYGVEILHGRFEELGFADAAFDVVLLFNVIENVPNLAEFLAEVHRVLKPGGLFILNYVEMKWNWLAALQRDRYFLYRPPVCYIFERDTMDQLLQRFGFERFARLRDVRDMTVEKIVTLLGWRRLLRLAERLGLAGRAFPIYAYPSKIVVARRGTADGPLDLSMETDR